tara:strand:+ start:224 stop:394 length:171 start_codon:yes stop_codon:yes gene_type:complete
MTDVTVQGLLAARRKEMRSQVERKHHQKNEMQVISFVREDKAGKCYTYRGVEYCYQ